MVAPFWFAETISQLNNSLFLAEMGLCEGMPWQPGSLRVQPTGPLSQKNVMHVGYIVILTRLTLFFEGGPYGYLLS